MDKRGKGSKAFSDLSFHHNVGSFDCVKNHFLFKIHFAAKKGHFQLKQLRNGPIGLAKASSSFGPGPYKGGLLAFSVGEVVYHDFQGSKNSLKRTTQKLSYFKISYKLYLALVHKNKIKTVFYSIIEPSTITMFTKP